MCVYSRMTSMWKEIALWQSGSFGSTRPIAGMSHAPYLQITNIIFNMDVARALIYGINQINIYKRNMRMCNNSLVIRPIERVLGPLRMAHRSISFCILHAACYMFAHGTRATNHRTHEPSNNSNNNVDSHALLY